MKFLINRSDAIGDLLLTLPMARAIKDYFPDAKVFFIVSERCAPLVENHPDINGIYTFKKGRHFLNNVLKLKKIFNEVKPNYYFYVGGSSLVSLAAFLKRVKFRGGILSRFFNFFYLNHGVRQKRSFVTQHETMYNLELLYPLGEGFKNIDPQKYGPMLNVPDEFANSSYSDFKEDVKQSIGGVAADKPMIFIHPGMTGHTLNWSSRNYARFILRMEKKYSGKYLYVVSYTPGDERFLTGLRSELSQKDNKQRLCDSLYFFDGSKRGLSHYMGVLKHAKLFLGPSTGTTHIANILKVKVIGIYSPIKVQSARRWGPFNRDQDFLSIVTPDIVCGEVVKCAGNSCPYYECMDKIEVNDILLEASKLLDEK